MEVMFRARYHDAIVVKNGVLDGLVVWDELVKVKAEQRSQLTVEQMPIKKLFVYADESVLEAQKITTRERITVLPVVDRSDPTKLTCALTVEGISAALDAAKNLR
jgi:CBS domain-containing protein